MPGIVETREMWNVFVPCSWLLGKEICFKSRQMHSVQRMSQVLGTLLVPCDRVQKSKGLSMCAAGTEECYDLSII